MSLALEIIVAILLACTIIYAFVLNRRLSELRKDKARLERLATSFNDATERAEAAVLRLKSAADDSIRTMQHCISEGQGLRDDLQFLLESGETTADKLEQGIRSAKKQMRNGAAPEGDGNASVSDEVDDEADAEQALLKALQAAR